MQIFSICIAFIYKKEAKWRKLLVIYHEKETLPTFSLSINFGKNIDSEYIVLNLQWGTCVQAIYLILLWKNDELMTKIKQLFI